MTKTATMALEAAKGMTFEQFWASLMELKDGIAGLKNGIAGLKERQEKTDELLNRTDEQIKRVSLQLGGLGNSVGLFMEMLFSEKLWEKFQKLGYEFEQGGRKIFRYKKKTIAEVDFFLENGKYVMAVEVKTALDKHYVNEHLERLEKIRDYFKMIGDERILLGAVAGPAMSDDVIRYAQDNGLYVIVQSGDATKIAESSKGFVAREWK